MLSDYLELAQWYSMLEFAEAFRPDLSDATAAYRHFLEGEGKPRRFSYERYVNNDESGRTTLRNAILEAQDAAINLWQNHGQPGKFEFTGPEIPCGLQYTVKNTSLYPYCLASFPYPATENWQKTIGAHKIWLSGTVRVEIEPKTSEPLFTMNFLLHAEDQYNFNPQDADIATGISDSANGNLVVVGFAHGYRHTAQLMRTFSWKGFDLGVAGMGTRMIMRQRQPRNNRRTWNRI